MKAIRFAYGLNAAILTGKSRVGDSVVRCAEMGA